MAQTSKLRFHKRADWKSGKAKGKHLTSGMKYYTRVSAHKQNDAYRIGRFQ